MTLPPLFLRKDEERRLRAGHLWVFSNEVDTDKSPLGDFDTGQSVTVRDNRGRPLGNAYVNPHALICARLYSRDPARRLDQALLQERLGYALRLRHTLFAQPCYRLAFGEGDGLPGLIVDRYDQVAAVQITTAGMERCKEAVIAALDQLIRPAAVVMRNDTEARALEGLHTVVEVAAGWLPETLIIEENGARFDIDPVAGQKTGWFYDHRCNRARMCRYINNKSVLDGFSYVGGWGITAAVAGARRVTCLDSSEVALQRLRHNAVLNHVEDRVDAVGGDVFETFKALRAESRRFDVVLLDPPALIKRKKDIAAGTQAYQRLNHMALQLLSDEGVLISSSCSYHMTAVALQQAIVKPSRSLGRGVQLIEQGHQAPDHPVHAAMPEGNYLKTLFVRLMDNL